MSYRELQWNLIFNYIKEEKTRYPEEGICSVSFIDEYFIEKLLKKEYRKYEVMLALKEVFQCIFRIHSKGEGEVAYNLDSSILSVLNKIKLISTSITEGGYAVLSNFKNIEELIIIKTGNKEENNYGILYEYFLGTFGTNQLRKIIPNFSFVLGLFMCNQLQVKEFKLDEDKFCTLSPNFFYLVYERIPGSSLTEYLHSISTSEDIDTVVNIIIQICFALEIAQREISFYHNDLHTGNIILRKLEQEEDIQYPIDGITYSVKTRYIPTFIDYGMSRVIYQNLPYGVVQFPEFAITPFTRNTFQDIHKVLLFVIAQIFSLHRDLLPRIGWLMDFFSLFHSDPLNIYQHYKEYISTGKTNKFKESLDNGYQIFFNISSQSEEFSEITPLQFLLWIRKEAPRVWKQHVRENKEKNNYWEQTLSSYINLIESKKIIKNKDFKRIDCRKELRDTKSYTINSQLIFLFKNILKKYPSFNSSNTTQCIKDLEKINTSNERAYRIRDKKNILEWQTLLSRTDASNLPSIEFRRLEQIDKLELQAYHFFINTYEEYSSLTTPTTEEEITFHKLKNYLRITEEKKSEFIFSNLNKLFLKLENIVFKENKRDIFSSYDIERWKKASGKEKYLKDVVYSSLETLEGALLDVKEYYPHLKHAVNKSLLFISTLANHLSTLRKEPIYLSAHSNIQFTLAKNNTRKFLSYIKGYLNLDTIEKIEEEFDERIIPSLKAHKVSDTFIKHDLFIKYLKGKILNIGERDLLKNILNLKDTEYTNLSLVKNEGVIPSITEITDTSRYPKVLFREKAFDVLILADVFPLVLYPSVFIKELHRVLKPQGILIVKEFITQDREEALFSDIIKRVYNYSISIRKNIYRRIEEIEEFIVEDGFSLLKKEVNLKEVYTVYLRGE